ncbi:MAG: acyltransferase family protein [bacterium]|nr:acyltransferase family protein [bacterium]
MPWVFWIGVYSCIDVFFNHMKFGSVYDFLQYNYQMFFSRFWFLPMVAVLYLMTPIVKIVQKYASKRDLIYALSLWFFAFSLMPFFYLLFSHRQQPLDSSLLRLSFQHVGLYLLGYMLVTGFLHKVRLRSWGIVIILSLILSYFGLSFQALFNRGPIDGFFLLAFSPTMLPSVLAIFMILFLLAKKWDKTISPGLRALFREMSEAALGIYLIHEIVMQVVRFSFPGVDTYLYSISPFLSIPLRTTLIFLLAFVVIFLIRRVPFLKYFV